MSAPAFDSDRAAQLHALAVSFPVLRDYCTALETARSLDPLLVALVEFAREAGSGGMWAALFVLACWNPRAPERYGLPAFDLFRAFDTWDGGQREAFAAWAAKPVRF